MKAFLGASLAANAALAVFLLLRFGSPSTPPLPAAPAADVAGSAQKPNFTTLYTQTAGDPPIFTWSSLESSDFRQYIANLRAVGCPEETIRDLVMAEVNKLYAPKFMALAQQTAKTNYFKNRSGRPASEFLAAYTALANEKKGLLFNLLGVHHDPSEHWANLSAEKLLELGRYAFLDPQKQKALMDLLQKYGVRDGQGLPSEMKDELASLLTPAEMHELELRDSNTANSVRSKFGSWNISEDEYRRLYALRKAYEEAQGDPDPSDPERARRRNEARQALNAAYKDALGESRYDELFKQSDFSYQALNSLASSHNVSPSVVEQAYSYQRTAMDQITQVFNDPNLSTEQRRVALAQMNAEVEKEMQRLIGPTAYEQYKKNGPQTTFTRGGDAVVIYGNPTEGPTALSGRPGEAIMVSRRVGDLAPPPPPPTISVPSLNVIK